MLLHVKYKMNVRHRTCNSADTVRHSDLLVLCHAMGLQTWNMQKRWCNQVHTLPPPLYNEDAMAAALSACCLNLCNVAPLLGQDIIGWMGHCWLLCLVSAET